MAKVGFSLKLRALFAVLLLGTAGRVAWAKGSLDAVALENIPLDSSIDCSRQFFKSAREFNGTIYVMPRVMSGRSDSEHESFALEKEDGDHYILALELYFPRNDEQVEDDWKTNSEKGSRCNFDVIKSALNEDISDDEQKIKRIAPMPLTSIDVIVPGLSHTGRIGRSFDSDDEVDILDYDGRSLPLEIPLTGDEKNGLLRRMERADGVAVQVRFRFQARSRDGGVTAKINWNQFSAALDAAVGTKKTLTKAELEVAVRASTQHLSASIHVDQGRSPSIDKISAQVMEMVLSQVKAIPLAQNDEPKKSEKSAESLLNVVDIKVAVQALAAHAQNEIRYEESSAPETATAETIVRFRAQPHDPNLREVRVRAGFANPSLDEPIRAGQTIKITPAYEFLAKYDFKSVRKSYLTVSQIKELHLDEKIPDLASEQMVVTNRQIGSGVMAVGKWIPLAGYSPLYSPSRYLWRRTELTREMRPQFGRAIPPTLEALRAMPIAIAFSNFGSRFASSLADLVGDHEMWTATHDASGTITLTAKVDLGLVTFLEHFKAGESAMVPGELDLVTKDVVIDSVTEERHSMLGEITKDRPVVLNHDPITIIQSRYVIFNVSRPTP